MKSIFLYTYENYNTPLNRYDTNNIIKLIIIKV